MTHKLLLGLPEDVYEALVKTAEQTGRSVEDVAVYWLEAATKRLADDPLEKVVGTIHTNHPNWPDEHDKLLGEALAEKMKDS